MFKNNPINPRFKTEIIPIMMIGVAIISAIFLYYALPDLVPIHWDFAGNPDKYGSKMFSIFVIPGLMIFVYLMLLFLPYLDPRKQSYAKFSNIYHIFKIAVSTFFFALYISTSLYALGWQFPMRVVIMILVGALFIVIGQLLPEIKSNWFMGIRTPWTLSSEAVWEKTHEIGGRLFFVSGFLIVLSVLLPAQIGGYILMLSIFISVVGTFGYSYYYYKKIEKN